ncbi:hypothetical protein BJ138DRAFT_1132589 [Hygrophoropsis aurantiaca]|uniref:Uncharacterized protein n=1 Tax=Hygrophoropsis aurantiaca TaxID=72124 RepID=A0ACB8AQJ2_9AGAM|nr:hypothetical protein BJ138DRAFT_1132589 [Hygrophoropsis aurantiaca]
MGDHNINVTLEQAQQIIKTFDDNTDAILSFNELVTGGYSFTSTSKSYLIGLPSSTYILLAAASTPIPCPVLHSLPLSMVQTILILIRKDASIPVPEPKALDISCDTLPFQWLLLSIPHSAGASTRLSHATLTPQQQARVDLRLGSYLQSLHALQNDWFGVPLPAGASPTDIACYSWQDTFTGLFEELLSEMEGVEGIPAEEIRRYFSRAFGSFLFDDAEVPCLIWLTGSPDDVFISSLSGDADADVDITYILPTFSRALWGDPLLETFFMPPGPSIALSEGYSEAGGGPLIVFPRQRTKRTWYTLFMALLVLAEELRGGEGKRSEIEGIREKVKWAREILPKCIEVLKDAPCY